MSTAPVNVSRQLMWGTALVGGLLLALTVGSWFDHQQGHGNPAVDVKVECRAHVRERLKAPSTAGFSDDQAAQQADGTWQVTGSVDSQNSFGAQVRSRYTCSARSDGSVTSVDVR